jgi:simple sugar transport system substrate-binding protein
MKQGRHPANKEENTVKNMLVSTAICAATMAAPATAQDIAVVVKLTGIPWYNIHGEGVSQAAEDLGVNAFQVGPANADPAQQARIVEDLITQGIDAIAVTPNDAAAIAPILQRARDAGIVVVTNESPGQEGADWNIEITQARPFAEKIFEDLATCMGGKGGYAVFVGTLEVPLHNHWADIGIAYLNENHPEMVLVTDRFGVSESVADSRSTTLDLLRTYDNLGGIAAMGSLGPIGAGQALTEANRKDLCLTGTALPSQAAPLLESGAFDRGTLWNPYTAGYAMVATAVTLLEGTEIVDGVVIEPVGSAEVDHEGRNLLFNQMVDITADNARELGF